MLKAYLTHNPMKTVSWVPSSFCVLPEVFENLKIIFPFWCVRKVAHRNLGLP